MNIIKTDDTLLEINQIKNINSISFKDIYASLNNNLTIIPGFIITYGLNNKMLFLTSHDKYFCEFVKKIREVYLDEKDHILDHDLMGDRYIEIDEISKYMLLNGNFSNVSSLYDVYKDKETYDNSLLFEMDKLNVKMPMIEYHLKETLKKLDITVVNINLSNGLNGMYYLSVMLNNIPTLLPIIYKENDSGWSLTIGNILDNAIPLHIDFFYKSDGIHVHSYINEYGYSDYFLYLVKNEKCISEREIYYQDKLAHYSKEELENENSIPIDNYLDDNLIWYKLPWYAYIGTSLKDDEISKDKTCKVITEKMYYVGINEMSFYIKQMINKYYKKIVDDRTKSESVILDNMNKNVTILYDDDTYIIETYFAKDGVTGFYKGHLAGNYFYQVCLNKLDKNNMIFLKKEDGLIEACDLLNPKKYIRK